MLRNDTCPNNQSGYSLISTAIALLVVGLFIVGGISLYKVQYNQEKLEKNKLTQLDVKAALQSFRAREGRYPCPAPMNAAIDSATAGKEMSADCKTAATANDRNWRVSGRGGRTVHIGALPTRSMNVDDRLGLDAWGSRILYAVTEDYTDSATAPFKEDKGAITIQDDNGVDLTNVPGNAIYAIILPGSDKRGTFNANGIRNTQGCNSGTSSSSISIENCDYNDATFTSTLFKSDADNTQRYTALISFESSRPEYKWNVSDWGTAVPDRSCGGCGSDYDINWTQTRTKDCVVAIEESNANGRCDEYPEITLLHEYTTRCNRSPCPRRPTFSSAGNNEYYDIDNDGIGDYASRDAALRDGFQEHQIRNSRTCDNDSCRGNDGHGGTRDYSHLIPADDRRPDGRDDNYF